MITRFLLAVVGLALGLAVSVFAQQNDTVGLPMRQEIAAIDAKLDDAINNNDPAIVASFFTEDAVLMLPVAFASPRARARLTRLMGSIMVYGLLEMDAYRQHPSHCRLPCDLFYPG
jgi:hypothetical protein